MSNVQLEFLGGAREVGRSCVYVRTGKANYAFDAGVKIGDRDEFPRVEKHHARELDALVLSHAHLDHSGYAPALYAKGFEGPLVCTKPTRDLVQVLHADYLRVARDRAPFTPANATALLQHTKLLPYEKTLSLGADTLSFHNAGHILGSALTLLETGGKRILYTGDVNTRATRLLDPAAKGLRADVLITESTYGGRKDAHVESRERERRFLASVRATLENGGRVLVPTFAIGRGQELLFTLDAAIKNGELPSVPVFVDGMVKTALRVYRNDAAFLKTEIQTQLRENHDPFAALTYQIPKSRNRADVLRAGPCVVLSTSGMLNGGPVLDYLAALAPERENTLVLVGYQAPGSLGRKLLDGAKTVSIKGRGVPVEMAVEQAPFSAHADHDELLGFARNVRGLEKVFVVHGEEKKSLAFARDLEEMAREKAKQERRSGRAATEFEVVVPEFGEVLSA